ncbi:hypothetical protein [Flavobacterium sp.]|uniref:hypothetical protein n=1 Tax=Flavobacterium sp. TaxID=239 RepID=UPI00391941D5
MKKIVLSLILLLSFASYSQNINDYQYVIVPIKFEFLKENDRYRLNTTTKFLLQKYKFKSYLSNEELPVEIANSRCALLYASLAEDNTMFVTKVKVVLKDCYDRVVFETAFGTSRTKEYFAAYNEALREAFKSFDQLNYQYNDSQPKEKSLGKIDEPAEVRTASEKAIPATEPTKVLVSGQLYAQPIANGFQLINTEPKVMYKIYNTSLKDYFIASKGSQQGVFFAKDGSWFFEYYQNDKLMSERVEVKF